jgi:hypothetical protein
MEAITQRLDPGRILVVTVFFLLIELDGRGRHDGRNRVLVNQLRLTVAAQQHAEIIEPADDALKLDAIDQKYGQRGFRFADTVQKRILQVLLFIVGHFTPLSFEILAEHNTPHTDTNNAHTTHRTFGEPGAIIGTPSDHRQKDEIFSTALQ